jgi:5-methylcytosine-specific restriction endonuclease McrA
MTKPISRRMAVDCILHRFMTCSLLVRSGQLPNSGITLHCSICDEPFLPGQDIEFDHIHADVHGGAHDYKNLRPLHAECHKKKTALDIKANAKIKRITGKTKARRGRKMGKRPPGTGNGFPPKGSAPMRKKR